MKIFFVLAALLFSIDSFADKTVKLGDKMLDVKGVEIPGAGTIGEKISALLLKHLSGDDAPGAGPAKASRWKLAKKLSGSGSVSLSQADVDLVHSAMLGEEMSVIGPIGDALGD